jgi:DNA primase small subunit
MHCPAFDIAKGWDRKILNGIIGLFSAENAEELSIAGNIRLSDAKKMLSAKDDVLHGMKSGRLISMRSKKSDEFWAGIINYIISKDKFLVDRQTSSDITKVIRVPDTIHGGTGLLAKTIPIDELKDFNPLRDAVIESKKETKIRALASYDFDFLGRKFSFIEKEPAELPESVAVYLLAKGKAELEQ